MTISPEVTWTDLAIAVLTAVLVLATTFYAWQTQRTVEELRLDRSTRWIPYLVLGAAHAAIAYDIRGTTRRQVQLDLRNVGPGHAWIVAQDLVNATRGERDFNPVPERESPLLVDVGQNIRVAAYADTLGIVLDAEPRADRLMAAIHWEFTYRDIAGEQTYRCHANIDVRFDEAPRGIEPQPLADVPGMDLVGHRVAASVTTVDTRPPDKRRLGRHAWPRED